MEKESATKKLKILIEKEHELKKLRRFKNKLKNTINIIKNGEWS